MRTLLGPPAAAVIGLLVSGCGTFLGGKIYSLDRGVVLPMEIEVTHGGGEIRASNPETGEQFQGTYVGIRDSAVAVGFAGTRSATAYSSSSQVPAQATMIGTQGTVLDCEMLIQSGIRPVGMGRCTDNRGGKYSLQF